MKRYLVLLLFIAGIFLFPEENQPAGFTAATFNINWGNVDLNETVRVIRETHADVIALQEITQPAVLHLQKHLGKEYPFMHFKPDERAGGFGFLSKVRLEEVEYTRGLGCPFGVYSAEAELSGKKVQFLNVHLCPMFPGENASAGTILDVLNKTETVHRQETAYIISLIRENRAVILGDFNSASFMSGPSELRKRGFVDSFASVTENPESHFTWHWNYKGRDRKFRIDYIFHSPFMKTVESRVTEHQSSDHYPVVSTIVYASDEEYTIVEKTFRSVKGKNVAYLQVEPKDRNIKGVFVYMHGAGNDRREGMLDISFSGTFKRLKKTLNEKGYLYICPDTSDFTEEGGKELAELSLFLQKEYKVSVFAAGSSAGGRTVWEALKTGKHGFSGAMLLSPAISHQAFGNIKEMEKKPLFIIQGTRDRTIQPGTIGLFKAQLVQNGFSVLFRQVEGGHDIPVTHADWEKALQFLEKQDEQ